MAHLRANEQSATYELKEARQRARYWRKHHAPEAASKAEQRVLIALTALEGGSPSAGARYLLSKLQARGCCASATEVFERVPLLLEDRAPQGTRSFEDPTLGPTIWATRIAQRWLEDISAAAMRQPRKKESSVITCIPPSFVSCERLP